MPARPATWEQPPNESTEAEAMHYSPLLEQEVPADVLDVKLIVRTGSGRNTREMPKGLVDERGRPARILATSGMEALQRIVNVAGEPGKYRIELRVGGRLYAKQDYLMEPSGPPPNSAPAAPPGNEKYEALLVTQLQAAHAHLATVNELVATLQTAVKNAEVRAVAAETELRTFRQSVGAQFDDVKVENTALKKTLTETAGQIEVLRTKLRESEVSPLDALGQFDGLLGSLEKVVGRFSGDKKRESDRGFL